MFFRAGGETGLALNDEGAEFVAINFGKDDKDVREAAVGDPHLLAIKKVMRAVRTQLRRGFRGHRIRT